MAHDGHVNCYHELPILQNSEGNIRKSKGSKCSIDVILMFTSLDGDVSQVTQEIDNKYATKKVVSQFLKLVKVFKPQYFFCINKVIKET